jgi:hypothetical protein
LKHRWVSRKHRWVSRKKASLGIEQNLKHRWVSSKKVSLDIEQKGSLIGKGKTKRTAKNGRRKKNVEKTRKTNSENER